MKKIFWLEHNGMMQDIASHFESSSTIDGADIVLLWQDVMGMCKSYAHLAHSQKKPVVVIQHGINAVNDYGPPTNYELLADKLCVWSQSDVELLKRFGISPKKYELTGTTIYSHLKPKEKHSGINVIFKPAHWDCDLEENLWVVDELRKIKGINVITKVHERHNPKLFDNPVFSDRDCAGHLDVCADVLVKADVVVGVGGDGTFELLSYAKDIPVITPNIWKPKKFLDGTIPMEMKYTEACHLIDLKDLRSAIWNAIEHPEFKREERKYVAEYYGGINIENPLDKILTIVNKI